LRQRSFSFADERLGSFHEGDDPDVEELVPQGHFQVGDRGHEAVVGKCHVVLHVNHLLFVDVDLEMEFFRLSKLIEN
jgi:hypothetical protein